MTIDRKFSDSLIGVSKWDRQLISDLSPKEKDTRYAGLITQEYLTSFNRSQGTSFETFEESEEHLDKLDDMNLIERFLERKEKGLGLKVRDIRDKITGYITR